MSLSEDLSPIGDFLIAFLCSARSSRQFYQILHEADLKEYEIPTIRRSLSRLHKKGLVSNNSGWNVTEKGKDYLIKCQDFYQNENSLCSIVAKAV